MKIVVLYRPHSEFSSAIEAWQRDFQRSHGNLAESLEVKDYDSREAIQMANLYEVMDQPTILVLQGDGSLVKDWQGPILPSVDEVANYAFSA